MGFYTAPLVLQIVALSLGAAALVRAIHLGWRSATLGAVEAREIRRLILLARTVRAGLVGLCLVGLGLGWIFELKTLTLASVVIGLEELYETGVVIAVLRQSLPGETLELRPLRS